ncbi:hypothetical protein HN873_017752, partial [Arachis hypogaea]
VAGVMTGVEGERKYVKDSKLIDILKLNITVLGEMVDRIKSLVAAGEQQLPVVIFQFARVKNFRGIVKAEANADTYFCDDCNKDVNNVVD